MGERDDNDDSHTISHKWDILRKKCVKMRTVKTNTPPPITHARAEITAQRGVLGVILRREGSGAGGPKLQRGGGRDLGVKQGGGGLQKIFNRKQYDAI